MTHRLVLPALALVALTPAARAVEPSELKPGLVSWSVERLPPVAPLYRLEPTVALTLGPGEAVHPRQRDTGAIWWKGYINIVRPGKYRFWANALGGFLY